jgi:protein-S-isoprenylcysteine O-methyltransferase Ste14
MASLWYTAKIAPITFVFTFAIALGHAVLLGLPLFLVFRLKGWVNVMSCVALGFAVGAVPASVLTLPVEHPEFHTSASVDGVPTATSTGWFSDVKPPIYFGSLGALGGFAFWVASIWFGICGKVAEAIVRTSCSSRYCLTRFYRG